MSELPPHPVMRIDPYELKKLNPAPLCGIYFLFEDEEIVYVGQTRNLFGRMANHIRSAPFYLVFTSYAFVRVDAIDLDLVEMFWIEKLNPKHNKARKAPAWMRSRLDPFLPTKEGQKNASTEV